jgi:hypothetical protein
MKLQVHAACMALVAIYNFAAAQTAPEVVAYTSEPAITEEHMDTGVTSLAGPDLPDEPAIPDGGAPYTPPDAKPSKPYDIHFRATANATYDDNIFIQENHQQSDFVIGLSAGATLGIGDAEKKKDGYLIASYDITPFFFVKNPSLDSVDHDASLRGQWHGTLLTLGGALRFLDLTGSDKDAGERVNRKIYDGELTADYIYGEKTHLASAFRFQMSDYARQIDTKETSVAVWADYQLTPLIATGAGLTLGYVDVQSSSSQIYEQINARANYALATKVSVGLSAGVEFRQVENGPANATPVFSLKADYSPYELLKLTLTGYRRVMPSIIERHENTNVTGVSAAMRERFLEKFEATLTGGFENTDYQAQGSNSSVNRTENYYFGRLDVTYSLSEQWRLGAFLERRSNASTEDGRSFDQNQTGINISFNF